MGEPLDLVDLPTSVQAEHQDSLAMEEKGAKEERLGKEAKLEREAKVLLHLSLAATYQMVFLGYLAEKVEKEEKERVVLHLLFLIFSPTIFLVKSSNLFSTF